MVKKVVRTAVPRVAAINDLSGFGRASLTVAIPILSSMEVQACPIPTAVLSTHTTGFKDYCIVDMTDFMRDCVSHWTSMGLTFDAVYSGFLGSPQQMDIVTDFVESVRRNDTLVVIDPRYGRRRKDLRSYYRRDGDADEEFCGYCRYHLNTSRHFTKLSYFFIYRYPIFFNLFFQLFADSFIHINDIKCQEGVCFFFYIPVK